MAPALSPQLLYCKSTELGMTNVAHIVTFLGSPPNSLMYVCTHFKARRSEEKWVISFRNELDILTILKTQIANLRIFNFFSRQKPESWEGGKSALIASRELFCTPERLVKSESELCIHK